MAREKWDASNIPDQKGRIVVVTGASSGLGKETARVLASKNARVILAVRNPSKGETTVDDIRKEFPSANVSMQLLDLASLASVKTFADTFKNSHDRLDLLINNAGVMMPPKSKTIDGFELQFGTNHLGHFALTGYLLPLLKATPESRIVNLSSLAHKAGLLDFSDLNWEKRTYIAGRTYSDSKLANLYFTYELDRKLKEQGSHIKVTAAHPGWTATELQRHSGFFGFLNPLFGQKILMGALPTLRAAIDEQAESGDYFGPGGFLEIHGYPKKVRSSKRSKDQAIAQKLWEVSEQMTGVRY